jgi:hypothetical protein
MTSRKQSISTQNFHLASDALVCSVLLVKQGKYPRNTGKLSLSKKHFSAEAVARSQGQGQVVDFITFYSTSNVFELLLHTRITRAANTRTSKRN